jgi:hypothetical protein
VLERAGDAACWAAVFPGTPGRSNVDSFQYMIDRTLYRPREIIQFCSEVLEQARGRHAGLPVPYAAIERSEFAYSTERAKDIAAEFRFQYPGLLGVFEVFRGRQQTFDRDELELLCLELATGDIPAHGAESWLPQCDPDELIEILWRAGLLAAQSIGDTDFLGSHQAQHLNVASAQRFRIHPMFHACLGVSNGNGGGRA